jgi:hypothetical protein
MRALIPAEDSNLLAEVKRKERELAWDWAKRVVCQGCAEGWGFENDREHRVPNKWETLAECTAVGIDDLISGKLSFGSNLPASAPQPEKQQPEKT